MKKFSIMFLSIVLFVSCLENNNNTNLQNDDEYENVESRKKYKNIEIPCDEERINKTWFDTIFLNNISFKLISHCKKDVSYIDTIEMEPGTFQINNWHDLEFEISYSLLKNKLVVDKNTYLEKLADDLKENGFLTIPDYLIFNELDSSVVFKTFIGKSESDVGDIYVLRIDKNGKTNVIAVESLEME